MEHDNSYKLIFSHAEMVEDLLRGFVREAWVNEVDFSTLERVSGSHVSDHLRDREDDLIWRVRWRDHWLYVYLLLEFQSEVDPYMALRMMAYLSLLYQALVRARQLSPSGKLPPVLPLVLYNGGRRWTAAANVAELIESTPGGLERYRPSLQYLLIDEGAYSETELAPLRNLAAALFRLENSRGLEDLRRALRALIEWLRSPQQSSLRRALAIWMSRVLLPRRLPGVGLREFNNLAEVESMLAERVQEWTRQWKEEGLEEGRREGRKEGRREGREEERRRALVEERALLVRLARKRFGDACAQDLAPCLDGVEDQERLAEIGELIVSCANCEALLTACKAG